MVTYSMQTTLRGGYEEVKSKVVQSLREEGFGILSEIDVQKALKEKLGVNIERYEILGACNPQLAHQALTVNRSIGLLLPCNVVLREAGGEVEVSILDPEKMFEIADSETKSALASLPAQAKQRLQRALEALKEVQADVVA
jgi:uncharacterized protein (DUF302 family)